ncbi:MAG: LysE/ArgO family amino acid transporter [Aestuariivirgaceae bacterium]|nr:LysE/ArgO family amino acid transporter [Aestuariivirgaceae bacterium]
MWTAVLSGFFTSLSLILAIGAQNAFVLRQGLKGEHVGPVVAICALSDALLIALGVGGLGSLLSAAPWAAEAMRWLGIIFLFVYGALRFREARRGGQALLPAATGTASLFRVLATCLMITWANPHVYLDTVILLGSISAQYAPRQFWFGLGGAMGSLVFFTALGYGARLLAPVFAKPNAWVVLEIGVGCTMWAIALTLALG